MTKLRFLTAVVAAGLLAMPVSAYEAPRGSIPNHQMPFPALMNSLFGSDGSARAGQRAAPRTYQRQAPVRTHGLTRSPRFWTPDTNRGVAQPRVPQNVQPAAVTGRTYRAVDPRFMPTVINYQTQHAPGTIIIDTNSRFLYLVEAGGKARRYGVGVGRPGFEWAGTHRVTRKAEWPSWRPPESMKARARAQGQMLPDFMPGGPDNPLGARALYLGSTLYRIHGSNEPWTIGQAVSSGCIRMRNEDVIDLYQRTRVGTKVIVM